jgi:hypothetical protein
VRRRDHDARPAAPPAKTVRDAWLAGFAQLQNTTLDPMKFTATVHAVRFKGVTPFHEPRAEFLIRRWRPLNQ